MKDHGLKIEISEIDLETLLDESKLNVPASIVRKLVQKWEEIRARHKTRSFEEERQKKIQEQMESIDYSQISGA